MPVDPSEVLDRIRRGRLYDDADLARRQAS
jgi:hypothetical protein